MLAATLLPAYSEIVLASLVAAGHDPLALWFWASLGNTPGSAVNWVLGRYLLHFQDRRWFPFRADNLGRSQRWFQRYGVWSLLLAWMPVGGDALTFIAGHDARQVRSVHRPDGHRQGNPLRHPAGAAATVHLTPTSAQCTAAPAPHSCCRR